MSSAIDTELGDIIVRNGTIIDGTGRDRYQGDVAVRAGRIVAVGPNLDIEMPPGTREIDATGMLVTPGWVDIHTHYDGQATWDDTLAPSAWHGVTTIVTGNCGVGFAPAAPDQREWLIGLMEGVEDIPGTALSEGIDWDWETFPEYLDALEPRRWPVDVGTQIAHGALRAYVMGERGAANEPATTEDIAAMREHVRASLVAGALGFSTSRTEIHRAVDGTCVPGTFAAEDELFGIGSALRELDAGTFELVPAGVSGDDIISPEIEVAWLSRLSAEIKRPVTFAMVQVAEAPDLWRDLMAASLAATEQGADVWPQVAGRATGMIAGLHTTLNYLDDIPTYRELKSRYQGDELVAAMSDPDVRRAIVEWEPDDAMATRLAGRAHKFFPMKDRPDYEPTPDGSLASLAEASGTTPVAIAYDTIMADGGNGLMYMPLLNYAEGSLEPVREMMLHPRSVSGLADGGAHCGASMPTFMLTHWTRDRTRGERLPLEWMVKKQTLDTARLYGLGDRGVIQEGMVGDLNVIDYDHLQLGMPYVVHDLPAGGSRILQSADGYVATIKSGTITFVHGVDTGARPGRLLRGAR